MAAIPVKANTPVRILVSKSVVNAEQPDGSWLLTKHHIRQHVNGETIDLGYYDGPLVNGHSISYTIPAVAVESSVDVVTYFRLSPSVLPISDEQPAGGAEISLPFAVSPTKSVEMVWHRASFNRSKYSVGPFTYNLEQEELSEKVSGNTINVALEEEYIVGYQNGISELNYDAITLKVVENVATRSTRVVSPTIDFAAAYNGFTNPYEFIASVEGNVINLSSLPTPPLPDGPWGGYGAGANKVSTFPTSFAADDATKLKLCNLFGYTSAASATTKQVTSGTGVIYAILGSLKAIPVASTTNVLTALSCTGATSVPKTSSVFDFRQSSYYHSSSNPPFQSEVDLWHAMWDLGLISGYGRDHGGKPQAVFADEWGTRTAICNAFGYLNYLGGLHGTNRNPGDDYLFYYIADNFVPRGARAINRKIQQIRCGGKPVAAVVTPVVPVETGTLPAKPSTGSFVDAFPDNSLRDLTSRPPQIGLAWYKYDTHVVPAVSPTWQGTTPVTSTTSIVSAGSQASIAGSAGYDYSPLYVSDFSELREGYFGVGCYSMYLEYVHNNSSVNGNSGIELCFYTKDVNGVGAPGIVISLEFISPDNKVRITGHYRSGTGDLDVYADQEYVKIPITVDGLYELVVPAINGVNFIDASFKNYEPPRGNHWSTVVLQVNYTDLALNIPYYNTYNNCPPGIRLRRSSGSELNSTPYPAIKNYYVYDVSSNAVGTAPELSNSSYNYADSVSTRDTFERTGVLTRYAAHSWQGPHWKDAIGSSALYVVDGNGELTMPDYNFSQVGTPSVVGSNYSFAGILANTLNVSLFGTRTLYGAKAVANISYIGVTGVGGVAVRVTQAAGGQFRSADNNVGYAAIIDHSGLIKLIEYRGGSAALIGSSQVSGSAIGRISLLASDESYVHTISYKTVPTGGSFTLNGVTVAYNASALVIQSALESIYGNGNVIVSGLLLASGGIQVTFLGESVASLNIDPSGLYRYRSRTDTGYVTANSVADGLDYSAIWYDPDNAKTRNGLPAIMDNTGGYIIGNTGTPDSLEFSEFPFEFPDEITVDGLEIRARLKLISGTLSDANVNLMTAGVDIGQNIVVTSAVWPSEATDFVVGGASSKFGLSAIERDYLISDDFALKLSSISSTGAGELDSVELKVYYREKMPIEIIRYRSVTKVPHRLAVTWNYNTVITKTFPFTNQITNSVDTTGLDQGNVGLIGNNVRFNYFEADYLNQHAAYCLIGPFNAMASGGNLGVSYFYGDSMQLPVYFVDATGSVPFNVTIDTTVDDYTLSASGVSTPPGVKKSRKRLLLAGFTSDFTGVVTPPDFLADVNAVLAPFNTKTGDPLCNVSYAVLLTETVYDKVDGAALADLLRRVGTGKSGDCVNVVEIVGGELVLATAFRPDATTFRGSYYYDVNLNQLFKKIVGKNSVAHWKNVSQ